MKNVLALMLLTASVAATAQTVDVAKSKLGFTFKQEEVPVEGQFKKFTATVSFDAAKPADGKADVSIDLLSVDGGSPDASNELVKPSWFDAAKGPKARFVASNFKALGGGKFQAPGKLTLKGKTLPVIVNFTAKASGASQVLDGTATVNRLQFGVGDGVWKDTDSVADAVVVKFHLQVNP
ncbi:YceI family protein [Leeia sp. TBRC 13508]|uniref:YceI family protein n=1 Tax=Leeia speluncae TaxID=2884804 RepID=A0ABS8D5U3_9NEIS|nr:YceI family protein [Leeia speluncae]MCB6183579.1 YceI family protein [Leeia speluncae]